MEFLQDYERSQEPGWVPQQYEIFKWESVVYSLLDSSALSRQIEKSQEPAVSIPVPGTQPSIEGPQSKTGTEPGKKQKPYTIYLCYILWHFLILKTHQRLVAQHMHWGFEHNLDQILTSV